MQSPSPLASARTTSRSAKSCARNTGATWASRSTRKPTTPEARTRLSPLPIPRSRLWLSQPTKSLPSQETPWLSSKFPKTARPLPVWAAAFFVRFQHPSKKQDKFSVFPLAFLTICCTIETAAYILPLYFWKGRFLMLTQEHLQDALDYGRCFIKFGKPASYIPELARVNKYHLGVCVV